MKDLTRVLVRPVVTEKTTDMSQHKSKYVFEVALDSNKKEIKQAVEKFFGVKVLDVRTSRIHGKPKRMGRYAGYRSDWKKAIVTVAAGDKIDMFDMV